MALSGLIGKAGDSLQNATCNLLQSYLKSITLAALLNYMHKKTSGKVFYAASHSATEAEKNSWKASLQYAHSWLWTKYMLSDPKSKPACESPQHPGDIPDQVYAALEPERLAMPPSKKYGRQSSRLVS